jgi:hypothetical protein
MAAFSECPTPLFLRVAYGMARSWRSYDDERVASLPRFASAADAVRYIMLYSRYTLYSLYASLHIGTDPDGYSV